MQFQLSTYEMHHWVTTPLTPKTTDGVGVGVGQHGSPTAISDGCY